jgi:hypothetical protein
VFPSNADVEEGGGAAASGVKGGRLLTGKYEGRRMIQNQMSEAVNSGLTVVRGRSQASCLVHASASNEDRACACDDMRTSTLC